MALPTASASQGIRTLKLKAILRIPQVRRFETFGGAPIHLQAVWSPEDLGLGGTCATADAWLECGLEDWMIQPTKATWDGPKLSLFYGPGVRDSLGRELRLGEGPLDVVGHFGDAASQDCRPKNRDACRDLFVVTAIEN